MSEIIELVQRYNDAIQTSWGDFPKMRSVLADFITEDTTLDEAESLPWGGHWVGIDGFMTVFQTVHEALKNHDDAESRQVPVDATKVELAGEYWSDGDTVISRITKPVQSVEIFTVRDSKITAVSVYMFDTAAMANAL